MTLILQSIFIGIIATLIIDLWSVLLKNAWRLPTTNWAMVGRWFAHFPKGKFTHNKIADAEAYKFELWLGWGMHYVLGIVYAFLYLFLVTKITSNEPELLSALLFGIVTVLAPWLILQPGLGLGICASRAVKPNLIRAINLSVHGIFGVALFYGWELFQIII